MKSKLIQTQHSYTYVYIYTFIKLSKGIKFDFKYLVICNSIFVALTHSKSENGFTVL